MMSFTSNVRSLIKRSPLGVASGVCSNLQNKNKYYFKAELMKITKHMPRYRIFKCRMRDLLDDVISVSNLTASWHQYEFLCTVRF